MKPDINSIQTSTERATSETSYYFGFRSASKPGPSSEIPIPRRRLTGRSQAEKWQDTTPNEATISFAFRWLYSQLKSTDYKQMPKEGQLSSPTSYSSAPFLGGRNLQISSWLLPILQRPAPEAQRPAPHAGA